MAIPVSHLLSLAMPLPGGARWTAMDLVVLAFAIAVIAVPFVLGGIVTTLAFTRGTAPGGRLYAADLLGAATGCLLAVLLLDHANVRSAAFAATSVASAGAWCFRRAAGIPLGVATPLVVALSLGMAVVNGSSEMVHVLYPKNRQAWSAPTLGSYWNSHAHILPLQPVVGRAFFWGAGIGAEQCSNNQAFVDLGCRHRLGRGGVPQTWVLGAVVATLPAGDARLDAIVRSRSVAELDLASADDSFDYRPPADARPFFFNMVRPSAWWSGVASGGGVIAGNLRATSTLVAILGVSAAFVIGTIVGPLVAGGRPALRRGTLAAGMAYVSVIGAAYMCGQVAFLQRFSVLLGHPTYALVVVLFSMLIFAGIGSLRSRPVLGSRGDRFAFSTSVLAAGLAAAACSIAGLCATAVAWPTASRIAVVVAVVAPLSFLLGLCFPHGARLIQERDQASLAWMWGANGAADVLASIAAVMVSMAFGSEANLWLAAAAYASLPLLTRAIRAPAARPYAPSAAGAG